jgi:hypothetical protein
MNLAAEEGYCKDFSKCFHRSKQKLYFKFSPKKPAKLELKKIFVPRETIHLSNND